MGMGWPSAEWRRALVMLRPQPEGHADLGLGLDNFWFADRQ